MFTKKMIALMVLATMLVSGAAMAGDEAFTVYGKLHASINYLSDSEDGQLTMTSNTSRFGFKGSKELQENMTFIWQFESAVNIAQKGANTLATRNSFLGLTGNWGTFLYGIHDTPYKTIGRKATFFYDEIGDNRNTTMGWDRRLQDVMVYATPNMSGFGVVLGYQLDQGELGAEEAMTAFSGAAHYKTEELFVGVGYEMLSKGHSGYDDGSETKAMVYGESQSGIRVTAKYDFGTFALAGLYQGLSNVGGMEDLSASTMGLEAKFSFSEKYAAKAGYFMGDPNTDGDDDEYSQLAIGIDRDFGQKTYMYLQYCTVMNGDMSGMGIGGNGNGFGGSIGASEAGESPMGISWGMVTKW